MLSGGGAVGWVQPLTHLCTTFGKKGTLFIYLPLRKGASVTEVFFSLNGRFKRLVWLDRLLLFKILNT